MRKRKVQVARVNCDDGESGSVKLCGHVFMKTCACCSLRGKLTKHANVCLWRREPYLNKRIKPDVAPAARVKREQGCVCLNNAAQRVSTGMARETSVQEVRRRCLSNRWWNGRLVRCVVSKLLGSEFRARVGGDVWTTCLSPGSVGRLHRERFAALVKVCIAEFSIGASHVLGSQGNLSKFHVCRTDEIGKMVVLTSEPGLCGVRTHRESSISESRACVCAAGRRARR